MNMAGGSLPGKPDTPNEDWMGATLQSAVVLDGLSAPAGDTGCVHGTPWFVRSLGSHLIAAAAEPSVPLTAALASAIGLVADSHRASCDLEHPGTPSTTVAMVRITDDTVDYLVLADSMVMVETTEDLHVITDTRVDQMVADEHAEALRHRLGSREREAKLQHMIDRQRQVRNQPGGYWVAQNDPSAAAHAYVGSFPRLEFRGAALLSDGVSRIVDLYESLTWQALYDELQNRGPDHALHQVRTLEDEDPEGRRWPRYKRSDDATAVVVRA
ncbi:MAG: hypothetical protein GEV11_18785 [Streptosporangiales bacterium]|nr:hypothetical protein [Streptosporangiales bacterium]